MRKAAAVFLGSLLLTSGCALHAHAQATWGAISGFVSDPGGASVPGANVTVTEVRTGVVTRGTTDNSGLYNITHLLPGEYTVTVEAQGFQRYTQQHVTLQVDSTVRVDCTMQLGAVNQEVTVTAAAPQLQSEKTDVSKNVSEQTLQALPVPSHNLSNLYVTLPGATQNVLQIGAGESPSGAVSVSVNGMWFGANEYMIDGITDMACCFSNQMVFVPNQESVSEMKMSADDYDPEFGDTAGLVAQYVTKSGTNQLHGSVFYSNRNKATFAADPFTEKIAGTGSNGKGTGPAPFNLNQGAVSLGGPIKKNKMFIFGDYQLGRQITGQTQTATVPTAKWRTGDFSDVAAAHPIFDPNTGNPDGSGRTQFGCNGVLNVMCPGQINTVSQNLLNLLPLPNINQSSADPWDVNYVGSGATTLRTDQFDVRYDWNIGDKDKMFVRNSYLYSNLFTPPLFGIVAGGPPVAGLVAERVPTHNDQLALNYTHSFGSTLLAEFRGGLLRWHLQGYQADANLKTNDQVGIPNLNLGGPITGGLAGFVIEGPTGGFQEGPGPNNVALPRLDIINVWEGVNNWTWMHGNHQIRWGTDIRRNMEDLFTINAHTEGFFNFNQNVTGTSDVANSGLGTASFLLGLPNQFLRGVFNFIPHERQWRDALYVQDVWRVNAKLTLNYGLRWDYFGPDTTPLKGGLAEFNPNTGNIELANAGSVSPSANVSPYHKAFAPRLGFAYKVTNNTVVRAGLGRSYFATNYSSTFQQLATVYPIAPTQSVNQPNLYTPVFPLQQGPPPAPGFVVPSSGIEPLPPGVSATWVPSGHPTEYVDQWNFTVERQFGANLTASVAYVGNKGTHEVWEYNMNAAPIGPGPLLNRRPFYGQYGLDQGINNVDYGSNSNYNSLQLSVNKRFSSGYSITSSFTWSKALDHEIAGFAWGDQGANPYDRKAMYGVAAGQDHAAVWTLTHNWILPYGRGMHWGSSATGVKKALLGGWEFNGLTVLQDGLAQSPQLSNGATLNADFSQRPDRIPGVPLYPAQKTSTQWFNPAAFEAPQFPGQADQCCRYGNAARGSIRGPTNFISNLALWKEFSFSTPLNHEATLFQIRAEAYNVFNYANWGEPNMAVDSSTAGRITDLEGTFIGGIAFPMRRFQFTLRMQW